MSKFKLYDRTETEGFRSTTPQAKWFQSALVKQKFLKFFFNLLQKYLMNRIS